MSKKRVIAHFMHETEEASALPYFAEAEATESYILGDVEENDIGKLRGDGLIVQVIDENPDMEPPDAGRSARAPAGMRDGAPTLLTAPRPDFYAIRLKGPVLEPWRQEL